MYLADIAEDVAGECAKLNRYHSKAQCRYLGVIFKFLSLYNISVLLS